MLGGRTGHIDDVLTVEHGQRAGFLQLAGDRFQIVLHHAAEIVRGEKGEAELQNLGRKLEAAAVAGDEAELLQRQQQAAGAGP